MVKKRKGFRLPERTALLRFSGEYEGAEVRVRLDAPLALFLEIEKLGDNGEYLQAYGPFAREVLRDWNVEDPGGEPIPASEKGFMRLSPAFANLILAEWAKAVVEVPDPLAGTSGDGVTSPEPLERTAAA